MPRYKAIPNAHTLWMRNPATQQQPTMVALAGKRTTGGTYNREGAISIRREIVLDIMYRHYHSY
jgi:hypothetical protein